MDQLSTERVKDLLIARLEGALSDTDRSALDAWLNESELNRELAVDFLDDAKLKAGIGEIYSSREVIWKRLEEQLQLETKIIPFRRRFPWKKIAVAASILLVIGLGSYFLFFNNKGNKQAEIVKIEPINDVQAPETNRAMITLANGQTVYLDSVGNGELAKQGNIKVVKLANGQIAYQTASSEIIKELQYNTLSNPRGSKVIDITLADGSRAWLNAGSSLTYPVAFTGNERKVKITGEAYFEVTRDKTKPFKVSKEDIDIKVLGTHFNVNTYNDENDQRITLLEGSVDVSSYQNSLIIKPNQQAIVKNRSVSVNNNVDIEAVMAWKNNEFIFEDASLESIVKELERWYDLDVTYASKSKTKYTGRITRSVSLREVLAIFEKVGYVKFNIKDKQITIIPMK